jgi:hypothetical protein
MIAAIIFCLVMRKRAMNVATSAYKPRNRKLERGNTEEALGAASLDVIPQEDDASSDYIEFDCVYGTTRPPSSISPLPAAAAIPVPPPLNLQHVTGDHDEGELESDTTPLTPQERQPSGRQSGRLSRRLSSRSSRKSKNSLVSSGSADVLPTVTRPPPATVAAASDPVEVIEPPPVPPRREFVDYSAFDQDSIPIWNEDDSISVDLDSLPPYQENDNNK